MKLSSSVDPFRSPSAAQIPNNCFATFSSSPLKDRFVVDENSIPTDQAVFFDNWPHATALPSPAQVRQASNRLNHLKKRQQVVCFPDLQLIVKYGHTSTTPVAEGQTLWLLSFVPHMRVPKVYGWCEDGGQRFIYMERVEGVTVEERWPSLSAPQKLAVVEQLNVMVSSMRRLKQAPGNSYIGAVHHGHIHEQVWNITDRLGPFDSVKTFTDQLFELGKHLPGYPDHPFIRSLRHAFSDHSSIVFTHADLHRRNIIMSATSTDVLGIIDWHEGGWYPEFWEYIKSFWTVDWWNTDDDWKDYVGIAVQPAYDDELEAFQQFAQTGVIL
ncbi:putative phosphotransferase enzyme family protein [Lyophyllum shimeji]|uniref:Phosphotransferase enzyme family protein n=1 Tax=Lyophyllum shimeji TaxID=47721 RepID=A0A9P3USP7_LYOSH|nr:putative phosphotransferase enzyme family protein [Lyophyllum shimeji]